MEEQYDTAAAPTPIGATYSLTHGWKGIDGTPQERELPFVPFLSSIRDLAPFPSDTAMKNKDKVVPNVVSRALSHNDFTNRLRDTTNDLLDRNKKKIIKLEKKLFKYRNNNPISSSTYSIDKERDYLFKLELLHQERNKLYKDFIDKTKSRLNANRKMNYDRKIAELKRAKNYHKQVMQGLKKAERRKKKGGNKSKRKSKRNVRKRRTKKRKSLNKRTTKRKRYK